MEFLSKNLKELRILNNKSQTEMGEIVGKTYFTYGKWEQGKAEPSAEDLVKLADYFQVTLDYLLGREDDFGNVAVKTDKSELSADDQRFIKEYLNLDRQGKTAVRLFIDSYAKSMATNQDDESKKNA